MFRVLKNPHWKSCGGNFKSFGGAPPFFFAAPETRSSSPVRVVRDESGQCPERAGVYPCGEGAGYAGGILSAAVDGIKTAEKLMSRQA